jgi:hypothetical protein
MSKQDRQGARTAADLERRYSFGKTFAEVLGIASDTRDQVSAIESRLRSSVLEQVTAITRDTEQIILSALEAYAETSELEELKTTVSSQMSVMAEEIAMTFESTVTQITEVEGGLQTVVEDLQKHFEFTVGGLVIKAGDHDMKLLLDNDVVAFYRGDIDPDDPAVNRRGYWDGDSFHIGNIYIDVDEVAQLGNYGFVPYDDGDTDGLDLVRVGG